MLEGCAVKDIVLKNGEGRHEIIYKNGAQGREGKVKSRWVIDAMGRRRLLQKKLKLTKELGRKCSAV